MASKVIAVIAFLFLSGIACKKDRFDSREKCSQMKNGIIAGNKEEVEAAISKFIHELGSQDYTEENINKLAIAISQNCGTTTLVLCFDCIKTLPTQTELKISGTGATAFQKIIDISYTPSNKMVFQNMHD